MVHKAQRQPAAGLDAGRFVRVVESSATQLRLHEARAFVDAHRPRRDVLLVGASRGAADDFARSVAVRAGATIGLHRFSLTQLAARLAAPMLAAGGLAPASPLGSEAVSARAAFEAQRDRALSYFDPVARTPGFPRALAQTLEEIRLARVEGSRLSTLPLGGADLAVLLDRFEQQFAGASATDWAVLFDAATRALREEAVGSDLSRDAALLLLDVPLGSRVEFDFVDALIRDARASRAVRGSRMSLITVSFGDVAALERLRSLGLEAGFSSRPARTISSRCAVICSRARSRRSASCAATSGFSRRQAKGASRLR